jgi:sarcosine oxidase subunit beta
MLKRWANAIQVQGIACEWMSTEQIQHEIPAMDVHTMRYPVHGGFMQRRGGSARHDAVAWGYARAADALGVDIIQNCEVTGFGITDRRVRAVQTNRGTIRADKVGIAVAGHSSVLAAMAGFGLPLSSMTLQAFVSEPVKPALDRVVISPMVHAYISQSDRGEMVMGAGADAYLSYGQRGNLPSFEDGVRAIVEMFPSFSRLKLMRQWGGVVDISPDTSAIIGKAPVTGMYLNCGWGTGGFKAIPAGGDLLAYTIANDRPHPLAEPFALWRFVTGRLVDEGAAAGVAH